MRPLHLLSAALLLSFAASPAAAQVLFGRVTDAADGAPVAAVQVTALDSAGATAAWALSGRDGSYEIRLPADGTFRVHATRVGFRDETSTEVAVIARSRVPVDIALRTDVIRLEGVEARSRVTPPFRDRRARGFFERMERRRGLFYTPEQIAQLNRPRTSEIITHSAGITMRGTRPWVGGTRRGCAPTIYIDGFRKPADMPLDDLVSPSVIWGIEVYRYSWDIPNDLPRDNLAANCGVIMIWTSHS
jgi:hypothetical protein